MVYPHLPGLVVATQMQFISHCDKCQLHTLVSRFIVHTLRAPEVDFNMKVVVSYPYFKSLQPTSFQIQV